MHKQNAPTRRFLWIVLAVVGFLIFTPLSLLMWMGVRESSAKARLRGRIADLQSAGLPHDNASMAVYYARDTTLKDVDRWMNLLDIAASSDFQVASEDVGPWNATVERVPNADQPWPDEAKTVAFMESSAALRQQARELALQDQSVRLPIEFKSVETNLQPTQNLRQIARLLQLEAQVAMCKRDADATRDAILAIFGCARAIEGQPLMVSQLVCTAIESVATEELRCALEQDVLDTSGLKLVLARIEKRPNLLSVWNKTMNGERGGCLPLFMGEQPYVSGTKIDRAFSLPWRSRDALAYLGWIDRALALPTNDLTEFHAGAVENERLIAHKLATSSAFEKFDTILSSLSVPAVSAAGSVFVRREMLARLAVLGIGVRLYEDQHAALPERLDQLSEVGLEVPTLKPLGDKPFGYRIEGDHATLWGFDPQEHLSTPEQPPSLVEPSDPTAVSPPSSLTRNKTWVWGF